jgi:hypothetical protein
MIQGRGIARKKPPMTDGRTDSPGQLHIDLGALAQRVSFTEESSRNLSADLAGLRVDMSKKLDAMSADLGARIDKQAAKPTDWRSIIGLMLTAFGIAGGFWVYTTTQNNNNVGRIEAMVVAESAERKGNDRDINLLMQPILAAVAQTKNDAKQFDEIKTSIASLWEKEWPKEAQLEYEKRIDQVMAMKADYDKRDLAGIKARVEAIDATIIKRPELEAAHTAFDSRLSALSVRENDTEKVVHSGWSLADTVRDLQTRLENFRMQVGTALIPAAPVTSK